MLYLPFACFRSFYSASCLNVCLDISLNEESFIYISVHFSGKLLKVLNYRCFKMLVD